MNKYNIKTTKAFEEELLDIYSYIVDYLQEPKIANEKYKKIIQTIKIDKVAIKKDIEAGNDIDGAQLSSGNTYLKIK